MMADFSIYAGLFLTAFVAATFFPAQSEILLVGLLLAGSQPPPMSQVVTLVAVASVGNTLGSAVNWLIGRQFMHLLKSKWFRQDARAMRHAQNWYHKYGRWSLLLSWAPFIGDPLTLVAGILKEPFLPFLTIVGFAKTTRYMVLAAVTLKSVG